MKDWLAYCRFRDAFAEALDPRLVPIEHVDALMWSGLAQLRCTDSAAILFDTRVHPSGAMDVHGILAAGALEDIVGVLIPQAEEWGRAHGCIGALIESRAGWARALRRAEYVPYQATLRKEL